MFNKKNTLIISCCWGLLGVKRGMNLYDYTYTYNKINNKYHPYMYSDKIGYGLFGFFIYLNPIFLIRTTYKEMYRLEVIIRGIEDEKNKDYYYELL